MEGTEDGRAAAGEEVRTRKMIGAGFAKKVALFFGEHAARVKHCRHVKSKDDSAPAAMDGDQSTSAGSVGDKSSDLLLSAMEEGLKKEIAREAAQPGKVASQHDEALKQLKKEDAVASSEEEEEEEAPKRDITELNGKSGKVARDEITASSCENPITTSHYTEFVGAVLDEIIPDDDNTTTTSESNEFKDAAAVKLLVQQAVRDAFIRALETPDGDLQIKALICDLVNQAVEECHVSKCSSRNNSTPRVVIPAAEVDSMKLVKEAMSEHQTFSRVLYVLALGTPITLLIARVVHDNDKDKFPDKTMIRNTALEMGFSFLAVTVCHIYIIIFHFVRTEAPRLSMLLTRLIVVFLCLIVSSWLLVYTFHMPEHLFRPYFWGITGTFLLLNWILGIGVGATGLLKEKYIVKV